MKTIDILVAVRNEEKNIPRFISSFDELVPKNVRVNIIFIEDGSTDGTIKLLREISKSRSDINYISLENKYGQYAALTYGLIISNADAVITMDIDGGHPIEIAVEMIKKYLEGFKIVQGHRIIYKRKKFYRSLMSYLYTFIISFIVGVNFYKQNVMFRLMDKSAKEKFLLNKKWWHIFRTNFNEKDNIKTAYINYTAPERELGVSKYNILKLLILSYKSFFAMLSIKRLIIINMLLLIAIFLFLKYNNTIFSLFIFILLFLINFSFYLIANHYPIPKLKIVETSLPYLRKN